MDLLLTGRWMDAAEAARLGLVKDVVPAALLHEAWALARLLNLVHRWCLQRSRSSARR